MLYPSGLVIAKPYLMDRKGTSLLSYTKHYYIGSERIASKIGTSKKLGFFPNGITSIATDLNIQEIKDRSDVQIAKANTALRSVYTTFELQAPMSFKHQI